MAFKRKRGKYWHIYYYEKYTRKLKSFSTKLTDEKEAQKELNKFNAQMTLSLVPAAMPVRKKYGEAIKINDALNKFIISKKLYDNIAPKTVTAYETAVKKFVSIVGDRLLYTISEDDYTGFLEKINECGYSINTIANYTRHLHAFFAWLVKKKLVKENFVIKIKPVIIAPHPPNLKELEIIFTYFQTTGKIKQYNAFKLIYLCAFRKGEAIAARAEDFDIENKFFLVRNSKGKRTDTIPMLKDIVAFFESADLPKQGNLLGYHHINGLDKTWKTAMNKLNLKFKIHDLRKARATHLANAGVRLLLLQKFMRHTDPRTTAECYTELYRGSMLKEMNDLLS